MNEDIIKRLENMTLPDMKSADHRSVLRASLLEVYPSLRTMGEQSGILQRLPISVSQILRPNPRMLMVSVLLVFIIVIVLALQFTGVLTNDSDVLAKAFGNTANLKSFYYIKDEYSKASETAELVNTFHFECRYNHPDQYHIIQEHAETILYSNTVYTKGGASNLDKGYFTRLTLTDELTTGVLDVLMEIETLPDETINGIDCYHYKGLVDTEEYLVWVRPLVQGQYNRLKNNGIEITFEEYFEDWEIKARGKEIIYDFWVRKDDYLIRQWKQTHKGIPDYFPQMNVFYNEADLRFTDFNNDIAIEPPLDEFGKLQRGWTSYPLEE